MTEHNMLRSILGRHLHGIGLAGNILWISIFDPQCSFHELSIHISEEFRIELHDQIIVDSVEKLSSYDTDEVKKFGEMMYELLSRSDYTIENYLILPDNHIVIECTNGLRISSYSTCTELEDDVELWRFFHWCDVSRPSLIAEPRGLRLFTLDAEDVPQFTKDLTTLREKLRRVE